MYRIVTKGQALNAKTLEDAKRKARIGLVTAASKRGHILVEEEGSGTNNFYLRVINIKTNRCVTGAVIYEVS